MKGKIIKTNNKERLKYVGCEGEIGLANDNTFRMIIENGEKKGRLLITSQIEEIVIKTKNSIYKVEVI